MYASCRSAPLALTPEKSNQSDFGDAFCCLPVLGHKFCQWTCFELTLIHIILSIFTCHNIIKYPLPGQCMAICPYLMTSIIIFSNTFFNDIMIYHKNLIFKCSMSRFYGSNTNCSTPLPCFSLSSFFPTRRR